MIALKFTSLEEFLGELEADRELVDRNILRATHSWRRGEVLTARLVLATAVVDERLVVLELGCGSYLMGDSHEARDVAARAEQAMARLEAAARELGLEVRPGVLEAAGAR